MSAPVSATDAALRSSTLRSTSWPQWRGPFFNGSTDEKNIPRSFSQTEGIAWVSPLPGPSGATPIIFNDRVFVSSMVKRGPDFVALCFDAQDGKKLWEEHIGSDSRRFTRNNMASPSPVTDGKLYCINETGEIVVLAAGDEFKIIFQTKIEEDPIQSSIAIVDGNLFIRTAKNLYCIGK